MNATFYCWFRLIRDISVVAGLAAIVFLPHAYTAADPAPVTLHWLGDAAPAAPNGITWGVPWPKGAVQPNASMQLIAPDGQREAAVTQRAEKNHRA